MPFNTDALAGDEVVQILPLCRYWWIALRITPMVGLEADLGAVHL